MTLPTKIQKFLEEITYSVNPKFEIKNKAHPDWVLKIAGMVVGLFNKRFDTDYITVINGKCWFPASNFNEAGDFIADEKSTIEILAHETLHEYDRKRLGTFLYTVLYLSPQIFAIFSLLSIFAIWNLWWLLSLLFLVFLAPIPSIGRAYIELRGYRTNMMLARRGFINIDLEYYSNWIAEKQFCGPSYYFMMPFKHLMIKKLQSTEFQKEEIYSKILNWFKINL
jgi:hypothetical protein